MVNQPCCSHCRAPLPERRSSLGRPSLYCGRRCGDAAYRARRKDKKSAIAEAGPTTDDVRLLVDDLADEIRQLSRLMATRDADSVEPLRQVAQLGSLLDLLTKALVERARSQQIAWQPIGVALGKSAETARKAYARPVPPRPAPGTGRRYRELAPSECTLPCRRSNSALGPVLSRLRQAAALSQRELADRVCASPAVLSRVLSGNRLPTWTLTERIARACGADLVIMRSVWDDEMRRQATPAAPQVKPEPGALHTALQTLHVNAGTPAPQQLARLSGPEVATRDIKAVLAGDRVPHWSLLLALVNELGGDERYFRPLWEQATSPGRAPGAAPGPGPSTTERVGRMIEQFGPVLRASPFPGR